MDLAGHRRDRPDATPRRSKGHGLTTAAHLLEQGATPAGRTALAEKSGISPKLLLEWVNHADLCRIKGVGSEYADLLEAAGVDTVPELAQRERRQPARGARVDERAEEARASRAE